MGRVSTLDARKLRAAEPSLLNTQPADLRTYLRILQARRWTIVIVTGLITVTGLGLSFRQTPVFRAEATVLVKPVPSSNPNSTTIGAVNLKTEQEVVASSHVASLVARQLGIDHPLDDIMEGLEVDAVAETEVLLVSYSSWDPQVARSAANAFAENYLQYRREQGLQPLLAARASTQKHISAVKRELGQVSRQIEQARSNRDGALEATLESERGVLFARLGVLQQEYDELRPNEAIAVGGGEVLEPALLPSSPVSPDHSRNGVLAGLAGLALGVGAAFVKERLDDRLRGGADIERVVGVPVLASVPRFRNRGKMSPLIVRDEPHGASTEAYRGLRTRVQFAAARHGIKSVLITSPVAGEGKTVTTANLGLTLAQAGRDVIVVSADLRRPRLETYFGITDGPGLSTWLLNPQLNQWPLLQAVAGTPNLRVLPAGPVPHNPAELLSLPQLNSLIKTLEDSCDLVLLDSAPYLPVTDAAILASHVGGTVLVVDGATHRSSAMHVKQELDRSGARVVGVVHNRLDPQKRPSYYHPYYASELVNGNGHVRAGESGSADPSVAGAPDLSVHTGNYP